MRGCHADGVASKELDVSIPAGCRDIRVDRQVVRRRVALGREENVPASVVAHDRVHDKWAACANRNVATDGRHGFSNRDPRACPRRIFDEIDDSCRIRRREARKPVRVRVSSTDIDTIVIRVVDRDHDIAVRTGRDCFHVRLNSLSCRADGAGGDQSHDLSGD